MAGYLEKYLIEPSGETARKLATAKTKAKRLAARIGHATIADFRGKVLIRITRKQKNAGPGSIRKTKKLYRKDERFFAGASHPIPTWETSGLKRKKKGPQKKNPLPVGRIVTVKARRRADGKIDLFRSR